MCQKSSAPTRLTTNGQCVESRVSSGFSYHPHPALSTPATAPLVRHWSWLSGCKKACLHAFKTDCLVSEETADPCIPKLGPYFGRMRCKPCAASWLTQVRADSRMIALPTNASWLGQSRLFITDTTKSLLQTETQRHSQRMSRKRKASKSKPCATRFNKAEQNS